MNEGRQKRTPSKAEKEAILDAVFAPLPEESETIIPASASDPKAASSVLTELRKLEAQISKDWYVAGGLEMTVMDNGGPVADCRQQHESGPQCRHRTLFIVALRNTALPLLTRQEEALRVAVAALERISTLPLAIPLGDPDEIETARAALASISSILDTTQEGK